MSYVDVPSSSRHELIRVASRASGGAGAPANSVLPAITGTATVGQILTCSTGTWSNSPTGYAYQWKRGAVNIGTNTNTYTLVTADAGALISCVVTASNPGGSGNATAAAVGPVLGLPVNTVLPAISGTLDVGQTLTATTGTWSGYPVPTYAYAWKRGGVAIGGATASTYTLVDADAAALIAVTVTATNSGGSASATSASVGPVVAVAGAALITAETNALGIDFSYATDAQRVAVKTAGTVVSSGLDTFFQNGGTGPKIVWGPSGLLEWTPHNLFLNSAVPATQSVTTIVGAPYTVTVTGSGSLTGSAGASGVATAGAPLVFVATTTSSTFTLAGSLTQIQMNLGRTATAYLATTAARRYGLAIDHDPTLGRTLLMEAGATNICLWSSDLTNVAWTKSNMTTALTATGPMGNANSATTLTASAGNATALQAITNASSLKITSVYLKRRTGTGNVDLTQDNGTTWATQAITSSWARYVVAEATVLNPTIGIRLVTSGDAVDVAFWQCEVSTAARTVTSPYPTFTVSQSRTADNYTFLLSTIPALSSEYSMYVRFAVPNPSTNTHCPLALTDGTANEQAKFIFAANTLRFQVVDGGSSLALIVGPALVANTFTSAASRVKLNDCAFSVAGGAVGTDTGVTLPTVTETRYGGAGANAAAANIFRLTKLVIVTDRGWSDAELVTKSAT